MHKLGAGASALSLLYFKVGSVFFPPQIPSLFELCFPFKPCLFDCQHIVEEVGVWLPWMECVFQEVLDMQSK